MTRSDFRNTMIAIAKDIKDMRFDVARKRLSELSEHAQALQAETIGEQERQEILTMQTVLATAEGDIDEIIKLSASNADQHVDLARHHAMCAGINYAIAGMKMLENNVGQVEKGVELVKKALLFSGLAGDPSKLVEDAASLMRKVLEATGVPATPKE
jgi:hypothetical protein